MSQATMEPSGVSTSKPSTAATVLQRCVCLVLACESLGNRRNVPLSGIDMKMKKKLGVAEPEDGADENGEKVVDDRAKKSLRLTKTLVDSSELSACRHVISSAKSYLRSVSTSAHRIFGPGTYLVPLLAVPEVERRLAEYQADLTERRAALAIRWTAIIEKRRQELGDFFRVEDFPSIAEVAEAYEIDWSYVNIGAVDQLDTVDRAAYERALAKTQTKLTEAYEEVVMGLRVTAATVVRDLAERLTPDGDGKKKALHPTALRDLNELLERLPILNSVGDDDPLVAALSKVGAVATGVDVEMLRKSDGLRTVLKDAAEKAVAELDSLVLTGRRAISFGPLGGGQDE